jgi:hypothetical protein
MLGGCPRLPGGVGGAAFRLPADDQAPTAHRVVGDSEFEHTVEDKPPAPGLPSVVVDRALVSAQQSPLGQGSNQVYPGQQLTGIFPTSTSGPLAARFVGVTESADTPVGRPGIGDHLRPWLDVLGDEGVQRGGGDVRDYRHAAAPLPSWLFDLDRYADQGLLAFGPAAPQPWLLAADVGLIHLDRARQPVPARTHQDRAQPVQHRPRRGTGADLELTLEAQSRDPVLLCSEHSSRP